MSFQFCPVCLRIYGEGKTQIPLSSADTIDPLAQDPGLTGFILTYKLQTIPKLITKSYPFLITILLWLLTKFNLKQKIGKDLWNFNSSLLEKYHFCGTTKNLFSILKQRKVIVLHEVTAGNTRYVKLKIITELFLKNSQNRKTLEFLDLKRDYETYTKKKISNLKLNH